MVTRQGGEVLDLTDDVLATYRLTVLLTEDRITEPMREYVWRKFDPSTTAIGYFLTCPWCVSTWVAAGVVAARTLAPRAWSPVSRALALSATTGILATRV